MKFLLGIINVCLGIKAPGYEERRRLRLKEKYNLDVPATS